MSPEELKLVGGMVIGWVVQRVLRAPKTVPQWVSYLAIAVVGVGVYIWITPAINQQWHADWRTAAAGIVTFLFQIRGQASASSDAKIAPPTDTK